MRESVNGISAWLDKAHDANALYLSQHISDTLEIQSLRASLRDAQIVNQAQAQRLVVAQAEATPSPVVPIFAALMFVSLIGIIVMLVSEKWRNRAPTLYTPDARDDVIDTTPQGGEEDDRWSGSG